MTKKIIPKHGRGHLNQFEKGESGNPKGRPKKFLSEMKHLGYKQSQVIDTIKVMMAMNLDEVKKIATDNAVTVLEQSVARALIKDISKGDLSTIETLLNRVYGAPKAQVEFEDKTKREMTKEELQAEAAKRGLPTTIFQK